MDPVAVEARRRLCELVERPDEEVNLAEAALLIACEEYPALDIEHYLGRLDDMAESLKGRIPRTNEAPRLAQAINAYLFQELGFSGDRQAYHDPRNSFLNDVLDRRRGIPITLSTLYLELARRIGFRVDGIGLPGHFMLRHSANGSSFYIDAFNAGSLLTVNDCREKVSRMYGGAVAFQTEFLEPVTKRQIVTRMLCNLKGIYISLEDYLKALSATDRILLLNPEFDSELRDRGLLYFRLECFRSALRDLGAYLERKPDARDAREIRRHVKRLSRLVKMVN